MIIDNDNALLPSFSGVIKVLAKDFNWKIDIGCCECIHTRQFQDQNMLYLDIQDQPNAANPFIKMDARELWTYFRPGSFDCIIALDFIEHLDREDGYKFIKDAIVYGVKRLIIFSPEGEFCVEDNAGPDGHRCGWTAKEFEKMTFQTWLCPTFHNKDNGAFLAWKTFEGEEYLESNIEIK
jgi:hypothetical protein